MHDLIYLSQVFYDSGFAVSHLDQIVSSVPENRTFIVIDGYHAFMARPLNLGAIQDRVFFLAGGYKYAMSGEGACFPTFPTGICPPPSRHRLVCGIRPTRHRGQRDDRVRGRWLPFCRGYLRSVRCVSIGGRARLARLGRSHPSGIHEHASRLQGRFLSRAAGLGDLLVGDATERGNFLTFRSDRARDL